MKKIQLFICLLFLTFPLISQAKSCQQGNAKACFSDALTKMDQKQNKQATQFFVKACNFKMIRGCTAAGDMYAKQKDFKNAEKYLTRSCNSRDKTACSMLGSFYLDTIKPANPKKGLIYKSKACLLGHSGACTVAGTFYVERSLFKKAKPLLEKACYNKKDKVAIASGCNGLGNLYANGQAVVKNKKRALQLYKRACDMRTPFRAPACENYQFQLKGFTPRERQQAEVSCNNMNKKFCYKLALIYMEGRGVKKNIGKAMTYVKKACKAGDQESCRSYQEYFKPAPSSSSSSSNSNSNSSGSSGYSAPRCTNVVRTRCAAGISPCRQVQYTVRNCN